MGGWGRAKQRAKAVKTFVTQDVATQDLLCRNMYDQAKVGLMEHLKSERQSRGQYWENAVALMVVHLTTGALESFINTVLHVAHYLQQPKHKPVEDEDLAKLIDKQEKTTEKWKWLGRRASGGVWFDKSRDPMAAYCALVALRNDLADHDKAPILRESEQWTNPRRLHLVEKALTHERAACAIVTVTEMVLSLRSAFTRGDASSILAEEKLLWDWAHVCELDILRLSALSSNPISAWQQDA